MSARETGPVRFEQRRVVVALPEGAAVAGWGGERDPLHRSAADAPGVGGAGVRRERERIGRGDLQGAMVGGPSSVRGAEGAVGRGYAQDRGDAVRGARCAGRVAGGGLRRGAARPGGGVHGAGSGGDERGAGFAEYGDGGRGVFAAADAALAGAVYERDAAGVAVLVAIRFPGGAGAGVVESTGAAGAAPADAAAD